MIGVASETKAIRTERLSKRYGDTPALDALDLAVELGEVSATWAERRR
jgi:ABC-type multidrug transport system ATPase subunit